MQGIESAVLLAPSSVIDTESAEIDHHEDIDVNLREMIPELRNERLALEQEVANLKEKLMNEIKLREALKGGLQRSPGTLPKIPGYVPPKTRELLFEVAVLEEEIVFLEKHAVYLRQELQDEVKPEPSSSLVVEGGENTASVSKSVTASEAKITEASEPTTPNNEVTPSLTPFDTPEWRPSASPSPSITHDGNMSTSSTAPSDFTLPLPMNPSPSPDGKSGINSPQASNRKRVIRGGSSSSESVPADAGEPYQVDRKPSRKKPNHKKTQSLPCIVRKTDVACETNFVRSKVSKEAVRDVYERLSAPKKVVHARTSARPCVRANSDKPKNSPLKWSANGKEVQSRHLCRTPPRPATLADEKLDSCVQKPARKKDLPGRSPPPVASPKLETKKVTYLRRSSSFRDMETECTLASSPSPVFEDKAIASIKRIASNMSPTGSPQLKSHNCSYSPITPTAEQRIQDRLVTPFKLPATVEKENFKLLTPSDERRRTHDLVITRSLPPIKLGMGTKLPSPLKGPVQHRLTVSNNFSENAKLYAKAKLSPSPTKSELRRRPVLVQKPSFKGDDFDKVPVNIDSPKFVNFDSSKLRPENDNVEDDDKDDKVEMACGPISDASWLPEDLAKLFGTVCSKIRRHSSPSDTVAAKMVAKPPVPPLGNSQRVPSFGRSQSFDIRSQGGLQLLEEYCSDGMDMVYSYDVRKHRSATVGPHRHYYKAIKLPLEEKFKT